MVGHQTEQDSLNDFYVTVHCPLVSPTGSVLINKHVSHSRTVSTSVACHGTSHIAYAPHTPTVLTGIHQWSAQTENVKSYAAHSMIIQVASEILEQAYGTQASLLLTHFSGEASCNRSPPLLEYWPRTSGRALYSSTSCVHLQPAWSRWIHPHGREESLPSSRGPTDARDGNTD